MGAIHVIMSINRIRQFIAARFVKQTLGVLTLLERYGAESGQIENLICDSDMLQSAKRMATRLAA